MFVNVHIVYIICFGLNNNCNVPSVIPQVGFGEDSVCDVTPTFVYFV